VQPSLRTATFGSFHGSLFLCFVLAELTGEDEKRIAQLLPYAKEIKANDQLIVDFVSSQHIATARRDWGKIRSLAFSSYSQTLDSDLMFVLVHKYKLNIIS
jgi:hypothetical protein